MRNGVTLVDYPDLSQRTYAVLKEAVLTGELAPGSRLLVVELAERLGVSRSPVKDALNRLAGEGLVEDQGRRGYFVSSIDARAAAELLDVREMLELGAAERGILLADDAQVGELRRLHHEMERLVGPDGRYADYSAFMQRDLEFHAAAVATAGNRRLVEIYRGLNVHMLAVRVHFVARLEHQRSRPTLAEHLALVEAFEARDLSALRDAIVAHLAGVKRTFASVDLAPRTGHGPARRPRNAAHHQPSPEG
jgi:DNA-binding GntR family transcriptional regulator